MKESSGVSECSAQSFRSSMTWSPQNPQACPRPELRSCRSICDPLSWRESPLSIGPARACCQCFRATPWGTTGRVLGSSRRRSIAHARKPRPFLQWQLMGSASLSVLFGLIGRLADKREHAKEHGLGSWAGRAGSWGRAGRRSLGDLGRGTGNRLLSRMPRAVDTSAQPVFPSSSRPAGARRRRDGEDAGEPLAMSEPGVRASDIYGSTAGNCLSSRPSDPTNR